MGLSYPHQRSQRLRHNRNNAEDINQRRRQEALAHSGSGAGDRLVGRDTPNAELRECKHGTQQQPAAVRVTGQSVETPLMQNSENANTSSSERQRCQQQPAAAVRVTGQSVETPLMQNPENANTSQQQAHSRVSAGARLSSRDTPNAELGNANTSYNQQQAASKQPAQPQWCG